MWDHGILPNADENLNSPGGILVSSAVLVILLARSAMMKAYEANQTAY